MESVKRTGRCIIADCDWVDSGFSAELSARINEKCFGKLKAPVKRIGFAHTPCPTVRELENEFYPNAKTIVHAVEDMLGPGGGQSRRRGLLQPRAALPGPVLGHAHVIFPGARALLARACGHARGPESTRPEQGAL